MDLIKFVVAFFVGHATVTAAAENPRATGKCACGCCAVLLVIGLAVLFGAGLIAADGGWG